MKRFTEFVRDLGVTLTPAQRVIARIAYDGAQPHELNGSDRELLRSIFGDVESVPAEARHVFVAVCGARAGKSYVLCALRLLHLACTVSLATLAPGETAAALIVGPDLRLARQTLRFAIGAAKATRAIAGRITAESSDSFTVLRDHGRSVTVQCLPATRGGSAVRGRSLVGAVLDECAFFRDREYLVNDEEIFRAIAPRVMPGGQLILASTPWAEAGLLYELHRDNFADPSTCIVAHAPTSMLRDDVRTRSMVARERERDPDNAAREFDALFMTGGSGLFLDPAAVEACVDADLIIPAPVRGKAHAGADFGFRSDSSACAILGSDDAGFALLALEELRPKRGAPLRPSEVVRSFAQLCSDYSVREICADSHYLEAVREHMRTHHIRIQTAPEGQDGKVKTYLVLRQLVNEGRLRLPRHARLIAQLKALTSRPTPGGGLQISSPRRAGGGHGDLVSALVVAVWRAVDRGSRPTASGGIWHARPSGDAYSGGLDSGHYFGLERHGTFNPGDVMNGPALAEYLASQIRF